eukprot:9499449-Pyramimonas_sp.AAC.1
MNVAPGLPSRTGIALLASIGDRSIPAEDVEDAHVCAHIGLIHLSGQICPPFPGWPSCIEDSSSPAGIPL